jgi:hypothetical protein
MNLKDACDAFRRIPDLSLRLPAIPATVALDARLADLASPNLVTVPEDLDTICSRIHEAFARGGRLSRRELRYAPWCIWASSRPLSSISGRLEALLGRIAEAGWQRVYRGLVAAYFYFFDPRRPGIQLVGAFLAKHADVLGSPWPEADGQLCIFNSEVGATRVLNRALATSSTPEKVLASAGLRDFSPFSGFLAYVYNIGFERIEHGDNREPLKRLEMLRNWMLDGSKIRFDQLRTAAVRAAVDPFGDSTPEKLIKDQFLGFALSLLGDPRSKSARWNNCAKSERIVRRWLTEASLRQFFDVVDRLAPESHWAYRRAFWGALFQRNYIDDAWVVFESAGARAARSMFGKDISFAEFGHRSGIQRGHSVLLLRIGPLVVAEWSHNGTCSVWDEATNEVGPPLHRSQYDSRELRKPHAGDNSHENMARHGVFWHSGSDSYRWQRRISEYIRAHAQIIVRQSEYEVKK